MCIIGKEFSCVKIWLSHKYDWFGNVENSSVNVTYIMETEYVQHFGAEIWNENTWGKWV